MSGDPTPSMQPVATSSDRHSIAERPSCRTAIQSDKRRSSQGGNGVQLCLTTRSRPIECN